MPSLKKTKEQLKKQWEEAAQRNNYRDSIAKGYHDEKRFRAIGQTQTQNLINFLDSYGIDFHHQKVVEIGCGAGRMTEFLAKESGFIYATDISMTMLKRFRERLGELSNVILLCTGGLSIIPDESIDIILSMLVFQHNPEYLVERFLEDGYRILKPGGYYIFQLSVRDKHEVTQNNRATDMVRWTAEELKEIADKHDYQTLTELEEYFKIWRKPL